MKKILLIIAIHCCFASQVFALKVFHVGNSLTVQGGQQFALKKMVPDPPFLHSYDMSIILGASMEFIYNEGARDPNYGYFLESVHYAKALPNNPYDILCLQPHDLGVQSDFTNGGKFLDLALKGNPKVQPYIYGLWPNIDDIGTANVSKTRLMSYYEAIADSITAHFPGAKPCLVIPVHLSIVECVKRAEAGQIPGVSSRKAFFNDDLHLSGLGSYVVVATWFACWYKTNPAVLPNGWDGGPTVDAQTANAIKAIVWEVCSGYSRSGVVPQPIEVISLSASASYLGSSYFVPLIATGGKGNYTWSITKGTLPVGLILNTTAGSITGTPTTEGKYSFTLSVDDTDPAFAPATKDFTIDVLSPGKPSISSATLTDANKDALYTEKVPVTGGFGTLAFQLISGTLPSGLTLASNGAISGTPTQTGTFSFTIRVTDQQSDSHERLVSIRVNELPLNGLYYRYYEDATKTWNKLPVFDSILPVRTNYIPNIRIGVAEQDDFFGLRFWGFINIIQAGTYTFYLSSDDGSALYIDDKKIIDYDGVHGAGEIPGTVTLTTGYHAFKLDYFENTGGQGLGVAYEGPGVSKQTIPDNVFFRVAGSTKSSPSVLKAKTLLRSTSKQSIYTISGRTIKSNYETKSTNLHSKKLSKGLYIIDNGTNKKSPILAK